MTDAKQKQTVLVVGGTGKTGSSVVNGLLESGKYHVIVGSRPSSLEKPEALKFKERGAEIRAIELTYSPTELDAALKGVDIVISTTFHTEIDNQIHLVDAAKRVGVKRFVPDDWASPCVKGVMALHDQKAAIHDYIKSVGLDYTFIDAGMWAHFSLPIDTEEPDKIWNVFPPSMSHLIYGSGDVKCATIAIDDIGKFVAEIVDDDRTLNKYVFIWGDEPTQNELWEIARKAKAELGRGPLKAKPRYETAEDVLERTKTVPKGSRMQILADFTLSMYVRGDNTVENAKKPEYGAALDAKELYPHVKVTSIEEAARAIYGQ